MPAKDSTAREYRERINRVIFHVERHLDRAITLREVAKVASFSPFHFHRIFTAFTGETLADFIRRLRLERAAQKLQHLDAPITDIALGAGYETPSAFSRAFRAHFGVNPTIYRDENQSNGGYKTRLLDLNSNPKEESVMKPEIRNIDPLKVLFARRTGPYSQAAGEAFGVLFQFASPRGLIGPMARLIGISLDDPTVTSEAQLRYDACLTIDREVESEGDIGVKTIAGGTYAVFAHQGPYTLFNNTYEQIFKGWLPHSSARLRDEPCFEVYLNGPSRATPEDLRTEIWLPIE
jgi:AraC family transcriptional regulator